MHKRYRYRDFFVYKVADEELLVRRDNCNNLPKSLKY
jgi:hypothetical protein